MSALQGSSANLLLCRPQSHSCRGFGRAVLSNIDFLDSDRTSYVAFRLVGTWSAAVTGWSFLQTDTHARHFLDSEVLVRVKW